MADNPSRKTSDNELVRALLAHFFLVTVHPFGDGNGRVSRVDFGLRGFEAELRGINRFIKTKLNRLVYRDTLTKGLGTRISKRRRLLNVREFSLLTFLLEETEPTDPFSENPSTQIRLADLVKSSYVRSAYRDVPSRTFVREIRRLAELGFIAIDVESGSGAEVVGIDFNAIEMDFEAMRAY